jgi:hypothetical protein
VHSLYTVFDAQLVVSTWYRISKLNLNNQHNGKILCDLTEGRSEQLNEPHIDINADVSDPTSADCLFFRTLNDNQLLNVLYFLILGTMNLSNGLFPRDLNFLL